MRLLLLIASTFLSLGCYASALGPNAHFYSQLSIHPSVTDTVAPNMFLPEGSEVMALGKEEKKYLLWTKISLFCSWATLVFFFLALLFTPLWIAGGIISFFFAFLLSAEVLKRTKHRLVFRKMRKKAKMALFIPLLYVLAAVLAGIGSILVLIGD
jgi:predicted ABC-type exoprotein transport system permease subunit